MCFSSINRNRQAVKNAVRHVLCVAQGFNPGYQYVAIKPFRRKGLWNRDCATSSMLIHCGAISTAFRWRSIRCYASERSSTFFIIALGIKEVPSKTEKKRSPRMQFWGWKGAHKIQCRRHCTSRSRLHRLLLTEKVCGNCLIPWTKALRYT